MNNLLQLVYCGIFVTMAFNSNAHSTQEISNIKHTNIEKVSTSELIKQEIEIILSIQNVINITANTNPFTDDLNSIYSDRIFCIMNNYGITVQSCGFKNMLNELYTVHLKNALQTENYFEESMNILDCAIKSNQYLLNILKIIVNDIKQLPSNAKHYKWHNLIDRKEISKLLFEVLFHSSKLLLMNNEILYSFNFSLDKDYDKLKKIQDKTNDIINIAKNYIRTEFEGIQELIKSEIELRQKNYF